MQEEREAISVIICAYTEKRLSDLLAAVASVQRQTIPPLEIIVVIDHNPALLQRAKAAISGAQVIENSVEKGLSGARNSGALLAKGTIVAYLDDDAIADDHWLEYLVQGYTSSEIVGVGGKIEPRWSGKGPLWFPEEFHWVVGCTYRGMPVSQSVVRNVIGANMSVRRQLLLEVGGFRTAFGCNHDNSGTSSLSNAQKFLRHHAGDEETEICLRSAQQIAGGKWIYMPLAVVQHNVSPQRMRWAYFLWRCYDEGLGKCALAKLHGAGQALASERLYVYQTLPKGLMHYLITTARYYDMYGLLRAGALLAGLFATCMGYIVGTLIRVFPLLEG